MVILSSSSHELSTTVSPGLNVNDPNDLHDDWAR